MTKKYKKHAVKRENLTNGAFYGIINISLKVKEEKPMKNTKKLLSLLLVMVMIFASNAYALSTSGQFTVEFTADTSIDLSDLKVELYRKTNVVQYTENLQTYDKEFVTSYTSDENGIITFLKPSYDFVLVIDLASLPTGTGVKKSTLLVADNEYYKEIEVETVETVTPSYNGDLNFTFQNKNGENLLVNYEVSGYDVQKTETEKVAVASKIDMNAEAEITVVSKHTGCVSANGKMFSFDFNDTYTYSPTAHTGIDGVSCLTCAGLDSASMFSAQTSGTYDHFVYLSALVPCDSPYCLENNVHNFRVYYDSANFTQANAQLALNTLVDVFNFFCGTHDFRCPKSVACTNYITNTNNSFCLTISSENGTRSRYEGAEGDKHPIIYMDPSWFPNGHYKAAIAHEFMHCIGARYDIIWDEADNMIRESYSSYAAMLYCQYVGEFNDNIGDMRTGIEAYFNDTCLGLNAYVPSGASQARHASILLPLMLHQYYGGVSTVRGVWEEVLELRSGSAGTRTVSDVYVAIANVIGSVPLRTFFENFGIYNYNYSDRYAWLQNQPWTTEVSVAEAILSRSTSTYKKIGEIGYGYYKLLNSPSTVQVTMNLNNIYGDYGSCTCYIAEVTNAGTISNLTRIGITSSSVNFNYAFSSTANNLCIFFDNLSTVSGDVSVRLTVN